MSKHSEKPEGLDSLREKIIGLGERSFRKSYYPKLQQQLREVEHAEERLKEFIRQNELILKSAGEGIFGLDQKGNYTFVNDSAAAMLGYRVEELIGKHGHTLIHCRRPDGTPYPEEECKTCAAFRDGIPRHVDDEVFLRKDGTLFPVEYTSTPIFEDGKIRGAVVTFNDITERKRAEEALRLSESRFRNLFKQSTLSIQVLSPDGRTLEVNHAWEELWGLRLDMLEEYNILNDKQLVDKGIMPYIQKAFAGEATEIPIIRYDPSEIIVHLGHARWVKAFIYPVKATDGHIHEVVLMHVDVSEMVKAEEALRESEEQYRAIFELASVGIGQVDPNTGRLLRVNDRQCEIMGYSREELLSSTVRDLTHPDDREEDWKKFMSMLRGETPEYSNEKRYIRKDGTVLWGHTSARAIRDASGKPVRTVGILIDVTERKRMEEEMRHMAHHDALTGLPNRRLFMDISHIEMAQARRHRSRLGVLFLDLDRFKEVNDTLGHEVGDLLLKEVAVRLKASVRASDTISRTGGDEFNIIVSDVARLEDISDVARKIVSAFRKPFSIAGHDLHVTPSIGISVYPDDSGDVDTLFRYADIAMYYAKEHGRNTFQFYNPQINVRSLERMKLEGMLRQTIEQGELLVYYQPQVNIISRRMICAEALVRWRHPEQGVLEPDQFIPSAEDTGFIADIDEYVLRTACAQVRAWQDAGLLPVCITVNLSAREFQNPELVNTIAQILSEAGIPPQYLEVEITETLAMSNVERTVSRLTELVKIGVHTSIDDFGTGYSSLNYLKRLPIEKLKIDRSFIREIATDPDDRAIISAVTAMAHKMRMKVIAEGVETEDQLSFLHETQCDEAQGYFFSKPVPAGEFEKLLVQGVY